MKRDALKITVVGGGSVAWTPALVRDMLLTPSLSAAEYVLYDIDLKAAELTKTLLVKLAAELGAAATFTASDQRASIAGSGYIIIAITTGGLDAMAHDLDISEEFGIYHTVGDTSGPGGWARLIRNFDAFVSLAEDINRLAPGAVVLNYTNPMVGLTDILARLCTGPVVGLCHGLFENLALLKELYNLESEDDISINYGGINHFFWANQIHGAGQDIMADLTRRLETETFTGLLSNIHHDDPMGFHSNREVATELFHATGLMPYLGDRHTCEFFACYITSRENMERYKIVRTTVEERHGYRRSNTESITSMLETGFTPEFLQRSRETAADIINAHATGRVFIDVGNLPNTGQISNLPQGLVVETAVRIDGNGFTPITFGALPPTVLGFIEPYAHVYPMTVDACFENDKRKALQALRLDPVCALLTTAKVNDLGERLLNAHQRFISTF